MLQRAINKCIQLWILSFVKESMEEITWLDSRGLKNEAMLLTCICHALNRADGRPL